MRSLLPLVFFLGVSPLCAQTSKPTPSKPAPSKPAPSKPALSQAERIVDLERQLEELRREICTLREEEAGLGAELQRAFKRAAGVALPKTRLAEALSEVSERRRLAAVEVAERLAAEDKVAWDTAKGTYDPALPVAVESKAGVIKVTSKGTILWTGPGSSATTLHYANAFGNQLLVSVDGKEVARLNSVVFVPIGLAPLAGQRWIYESKTDVGGTAFTSQLEFEVLEVKAGRVRYRMVIQAAGKRMPQPEAWWPLAAPGQPVVPPGIAPPPPNKSLQTITAAGARWSCQVTEVTASGSHSRTWVPQAPDGSPMWPLFLRSETTNASAKLKSTMNLMKVEGP
jgi:hypothetical protein